MVFFQIEPSHVCNTSTLEHTVPLVEKYTHSGYYRSQYKLTYCQIPNLITGEGADFGKAITLSVDTYNNTEVTYF